MTERTMQPAMQRAMERAMGAPSPAYQAGWPIVQRLSALARAAFERLVRNVQSSGRLLAIEERISIGPKKTLMLVSCAGRRFLVATASETVGPLIEVLPGNVQPNNVLPGDVRSFGENAARRDEAGRTIEENLR
jgi:hypothetical protein